MTGAARHGGVSKALICDYHGSKAAPLHDIRATHLTDLVETARAIASVAGLCPLVGVLLEACEDADAEHTLRVAALSVLPEDLPAPLIARGARAQVGIMPDCRARETPGLAGTDRLRLITLSVFGILNWLHVWHRPGKGLSRANCPPRHRLGTERHQGHVARPRP